MGKSLVLGIVKNLNVKRIISRQLYYQIVHHHNKMPLIP